MSSWVVAYLIAGTRMKFVTIRTLYIWEIWEAAQLMRSWGDRSLFRRFKMHGRVKTRRFGLKIAWANVHSLGIQECRWHRVLLSEVLIGSVNPCFRLLLAKNPQYRSFSIVHAARQWRHTVLFACQSRLVLIAASRLNVLNAIFNQASNLAHVSCVDTSVLKSGLLQRLRLKASWGPHTWLASHYARSDSFSIFDWQLELACVFHFPLWAIHVWCLRVVDFTHRSSLKKFISLLKGTYYFRLSLWTQLIVCCVWVNTRLVQEAGNGLSWNYARLLRVNLVDHLHLRANMRECLQVDWAIFCVLPRVEVGVVSRILIYRDSVS